MSIDASADGNEVIFSNKLLYTSGRSTYKENPIILINHQDTYFYTEDTSAADARNAGFGIQGIELKGFNTSTVNRWGDDTTGGERNVDELWLVDDAQPQVLDCKLRNAKTLLHTTSTRSGNFPEQVTLRGQISDYTIGWLVDESGSGTGSHEHFDADLVITQGKKDGVIDKCIRIVNGANLYRGNLKLRGRANSSGVEGTHDGADNAATLTDSSASWVPDQYIGEHINNVTDGSQGVVTSNTATTITATLSGGTDNDWDIGDEYEIRGAIIEVDGSSPDSTFRNNTRVDIALDRSVNTDLIRGKNGGAITRNQGIINGGFRHLRSC